MLWARKAALTENREDYFYFLMLHCSSGVREEKGRTQVGHKKQRNKRARARAERLGAARKPPPKTEPKLVTDCAACVSINVRTVRGAGLCSAALYTSRPSLMHQELAPLA